MSANRCGTIVAAFGRHYEIELTEGALKGTLTTGYPRAKKSIYTCGDDVELSGDGQILVQLPRRTLLYRADAYRQKLIAANVTQIILVVATEPSFSDSLLTRALVAAEHENLEVLIILNKSDLPNGLAAARALLAPYAELGYRVLEMWAKRDVGLLMPLLKDHVSVLVGQSGMGKSTLTNAIVPEAEAATREISSALDSGKHTTTHARLYRIAGGGSIIDCPGLQEFGLSHLSPAEIEYGFLDFRPHLGQCRFRDCRHRSEPGCAIKTAVEAGSMHPRRLEHFHQLVAALGIDH